MSDSSAKQHSESFKLLSAIQTIDSMNASAERRLSWNEIRNWIDVITDGHLTVGTKLPSDLDIYRVRKLGETEHFPNVSQLMARSHEEVYSYGRCNEPGKSVFYGALNIETAFSEMGLAVGDRAQSLVTRLDLNATEPLTTAILGEIDYARRFNAPSAVGHPDTTSFIRKHWDSLNDYRLAPVGSAMCF